jgi:hypothetical protein
MTKFKLLNKDVYLDTGDKTKDYRILFFDEQENIWEESCGLREISKDIKKLISEAFNFLPAASLKGIKHPVFSKAVIDPVTWKLTCENCGAIHKISTDTIEIDPCCEDPGGKKDGYL